MWAKFDKQLQCVDFVSSPPVHDPDHDYQYVDEDNELELRVMKTYLNQMSTLTYNHVIRLYDKDGNHTLSVLRCLDDMTMFDLADPRGNVLCCMPIGDFSSLVLLGQFGAELIKS